MKKLSSLVNNDKHTRSGEAEVWLTLLVVDLELLVERIQLLLENMNNFSRLDVSNKKKKSSDKYN